MLYENILNYEDLSDSRLYNFICEKIDIKIKINKDIKLFIYTEDNITSTESLLKYNKFLGFCLVNMIDENFTCLINNFFISDTEDEENCNIFIEDLIYSIGFIDNDVLNYKLLIDIELRNIEKYLYYLTSFEFKNPIIANRELLIKSELKPYIEDSDRVYIYMIRNIYNEYLYEYDHEKEIEEHLFDKNFISNRYVNHMDINYEKLKEKYCMIEYDKAKFLLLTHKNYNIYKYIKDDPDLLKVRLRFDLPTLKILNRLPYSDDKKISKLGSFVDRKNQNMEYSGIFRINSIENDIINLELDNYKSIPSENKHATSKLQIGKEYSINVEKSTFNFHSHPYTFYNILNNYPSPNDILISFNEISSDLQNQATFISSHFGIFCVSMKSPNYKDRYKRYMDTDEVFEDLITLEKNLKLSKYNFLLKSDLECYDRLNINFTEEEKIDFYRYTSNMYECYTLLYDVIYKYEYYARTLDERNMDIEKELENLKYVNGIFNNIDRLNYDIDFKEIGTKIYYLGINKFDIIYKLVGSITEIYNILNEVEDQDIQYKLSISIDYISKIADFLNTIRYPYNSIYEYIKDIHVRYDNYVKVYTKNIDEISTLISYFTKNKSDHSSEIIVDRNVTKYFTTREKLNIIFKIYALANVCIITTMDPELKNIESNEIAIKPYSQYNYLMNELEKTKYHKDRKKVKLNKNIKQNKYNDIKTIDRITYKMNKLFIESFLNTYPSIFKEMFNIKFLTWYRLYKGDTFELFLQPQLNNIQPDMTFMYDIEEIPYDKNEDTMYLLDKISNDYYLRCINGDTKEYEEKIKEIEDDVLYDRIPKERIYEYKKRKMLEKQSIIPYDNIPVDEDNYVYRKGIFTKEYADEDYLELDRIQRKELYSDYESDEEDELDKIMKKNIYSDSDNEDY